MRARRMLSAFALALGLLPIALPNAPARAEVRNLTARCENQLCPWFQAVVATPKGWIVNKVIGERNRVLMFQPDRLKRDANDPLLYIMTSLQEDETSVDDFVRQSQSHWREAVSDAKIERLADVARPGKPTAQLYRYENPSRPRQANELIAFLEGSESDGRRFIHMVVLTATNAKAIEDAEHVLKSVTAAL